jgi:hypothetical protein
VKLWKRIQQLSIKQLFRLTFVMLGRPMLVYPTWKATKQTLTICNSLYGKAHHKNGIENAFRHALWNVLICQKTLKITKNKEKSVFWAKKVTHLHEKLAKNGELETAMDLHNNAMGRIQFLELLEQNEAKMIDFIQKRLQNAKKVNEIKEIEIYTNELVYISE